MYVQFPDVKPIARHASCALHSAREDGDAVGRADGPDEGDALGAAVGDCDGLPLGAGDGDVLGDALGLAVGLAVGLSVENSSLQLAWQIVSD